MPDYVPGGIRFARGLEASIPTLQPGEPGFALDTGRLFVGSEEGNIPVSGTGPEGPEGPEGPAGPGMPVGAIIAYGGATAPEGWLLCNGQEVSRTTYADLFAVIGEEYGDGDESTTFNVPDLRDRFAFGWDGMDPEDLGQVGGAASVTLSAANLPAHQHAVGMRNDGSVVAGNIQIGSTGNTFAFDSAGTIGRQTSGGADGLSGSAGSGTAFPIIPPSIRLNYIIKT